MELKTKRRTSTGWLRSSAFLLFTSVLLACSQIGYARTNLLSMSNQEKLTITGKVIDNANEPLTGVTVIIKGTSTGTVTDANGNYKIEASTGDIIVFSFIGMKSKEFTVGSEKIINVTLESDNQNIDELVVIGYGVTRKSDLTGAVSGVKKESIEKFSVSNPAEALQGRISGVSIEKSNGGAPGGAMNIRVRGINTTGDNAPLYIIDGFPGSLSLLNPNDIESIEVLKDGSAAAIYGSRAANGVILISTKNGKKGDVQVDVKFDYGVTQNTNQLKFTDAQEYVNIAKMAYDNAGLSIPNYLNMPIQYNTNWQKEIFKQGNQKNTSISLSGATDLLSYYISTNLFDQEGTMIGTGFNKASVNAKGSMKKGIFTLNSNISYTETKQNEQKIFLRGAYEIVPLIPVFDSSQPDGYGLADVSNNMPSSRNPVGDNHFNTAYNTNHYLETKISGNIELFKGFNYKLNLGLNNSDNFKFNQNPPYIIDIKDPTFYSYISEQRGNLREGNVEHILSYNKELNKHSFSLMAAYTASKTTYKETGSSVTGYTNVYSADGTDVITNEIPGGFLDPNFKTLDAGIGGTFAGWGTEYTYTRVSQLGRFSYSYDKKYLVQFTVRRDGSSKFGSNNRYGVFPSVSLGWKISNEPFMKGFTAISNLKLRGSWGVLGSEGVLGYYDFQSLISTKANEFYYYSKGTGETPWAGSIARTMANTNLKWEELNSKNIGIDFGLFESRIEGSFNLYKNVTTDMLVEKPVPPSSGIDPIKANFGKMQNTGFEIELGYKGEVGDFKYDLNGTFSRTKNEVLRLGYKNAVVYGEAVNYTEHIPNQTRIGHEIGAFYLYQMDGIFQSQAEIDAYNAKGTDGPLQPDASPGDIRFKDVNGDGKLDSKDVVYSGSGIPKFEYGIAFNAEYKGLDLSLTISGAGGYKIYNANRYYTERMNNNYNYAATCANAWTSENGSNSMPRPVIGDPNGNARESTRFLEDGDYLRIKNIQVGYTLPQKLTKVIKVDRLRLYLSAQNLKTFTKYNGFDPEVSRSSIWSAGLDRTLYPISKTFIMGLQFNF